LSSALASPAQKEALYEKLAAFGTMPAAAAARAQSLDRFFATASGRERPGHFWRVDFESLTPEAATVDPSSGSVTIENHDPKIVACDLRTALREYPELLARAMRTTAAGTRKFGALTEAFAGMGAFVYAPADRACDEPVVIRYDAGPAAIFPWSIVLAERGSRLSIVERITGGPQAFVCGACEVVTEANAEVSYAVLQVADDGARTISTRIARPGRDARIAWAVAEVGGALAADDLTVSIEEPGSESRVTALFFPAGSQHVDVVSTVDHRAGEATSETVVKSAARERGQARFLGNIRIAPHAQGSDARLRDDALLLSATAHVDSVPALEIGANDVKAYHGATVGAIDAEQIFYMESRGIEAPAAERMIALGFFEPAIEHFPTALLRDEIRAALAAKLS
jgi:Fe-S cluster assembly protein SufD